MKKLFSLIILHRRIKILLCYIGVILIFFILAFLTYKHGEKQMNRDYNRAIELYSKDEYDEAKKLFDELGDYKESEIYLQKISYSLALSEMENRYIHIEAENDVSKRIEGLKELVIDTDNLIDLNSSLGGDFTKGAKQLKNSVVYSTAIDSYNDRRYEDALLLFQSVKDYKNSEYYIAQITFALYPDAQKSLYANAVQLFENGEYQKAAIIFDELKDYEDSVDKAIICRRYDLAKTVSAGIRGTFFVNNEQTVKFTGDVYDKLREINTGNNLISISAKDAVLVTLDREGNATVYGNINNSQKESFDSKRDVVQVAAGELYAVALLSDGKVYAVGHNGDGQCDVEEKWASYYIKEISCGWRTTVGLSAEGEILVSGYRESALKSEITANEEKWSNIVHIACAGGGNQGIGHIVALRDDGRVVAAGDNSMGQCNVDEWENVYAISAGDFHTVGLRKDGTAYITNKEGYRIVSFPEKIVDISAGYGYTIFVGESGKAYTNENSYNNQGQVNNIDEWRVLVIKRNYDMAME